jgi:hypothetical protein
MRGQFVNQGDVASRFYEIHSDLSALESLLGVLVDRLAEPEQWADQRRAAEVSADLARIAADQIHAIIGRCAPLPLELRFDPREAAERRFVAPTNDRD